MRRLDSAVWNGTGLSTSEAAEVCWADTTPQEVQKTRSIGIVKRKGFMKQMVKKFAPSFQAFATSRDIRKIQKMCGRYRLKNVKKAFD